MLMQNFGVTNKEYYGMLWYFLEWLIMFSYPFVKLVVKMLQNSLHVISMLCD